MTRGGHRYPIEHTEGCELDFASLLWEAFFSDRSPQGGHFRSELDDVYLRSRRLIGVLTSYRTPSWNGPYSETFSSPGVSSVIFAPNGKVHTNLLHI